MPAFHAPPAYVSTIAGATCAERFARSGAIKVSGTVSEGGVLGSFAKIVSLKSGYYTIRKQMGVHDERSGFDGAAWGWSDGILSNIDLPTQLAYRRARAFIERLAWNDARPQTAFSAPQMDTVQITYGARFASAVSIDADDGPETTQLRNWHCSAGIYYPFEQDTVDSSGERSILRVINLQRITDNPNVFDAPPMVNRGSISGAQPAEVPFKTTGKREQHLLVHGSIDGHDATLLFDTGAANYIGPRSAAAWNLPVSGGLNVGGAGAGSVAGGFALFRTVALGRAQLTDQIGVVAPLPWPDKPAFPNGLIGLEFYATFRMTIDYQRKVLEFETFDRPSTSAGVSMHFYNNDGHMYVNAEVNGLRGIFGIDTGDGNAVVLFKRFADIAHVTAIGSTAETGGGVGGAISTAPARIASFAFAGSRISGIRAVISGMHSGAFASRTLAGNLGGGLFRCYAMTIDYPAATITFSREPDTDDCFASLR